MEQWKIRTMQEVIEKSKSLHSRVEYLEGAKSQKRIDLANFFNEIVNIGNGFPPRPSYTTRTAELLKKRVNDSCPACVKRKAMKVAVDDAVRFIQAYTKTLEEFLEGKSTADNPISVHDLKPTDND